MFKKVSTLRVFFGVMFITLFMFLLQLWIRNWKKKQVIFTYKLKPTSTPPKEATSIAASKKESGKQSKDDLTVISGIGPKTSARLQNLGINSYKQISEMKPEELTKFLKDTNLRPTNVESWIAQCKQLAK